MSISVEDTVKRIKADLYAKNIDISVLTEDMDDILFWKDILEIALPNKKLEFPGEYRIQAAGKSTLQTYHSFVDEKLIICQDSDSEFLWKENRTPNQIPFIYETYVYSIENYCLYPAPLSKLVYDITFAEYNFESFFEAYCTCVNDLFYLWVYAKMHQIEAINIFLNKEQLKQLLSLDLDRFDSLSDESALFKELAHRIEEYFEIMKQEIGEEWFEAIMKDDLPELKESLEQKWQIQQKNIAQFFRGHTMFDDVFLPFLTRLIEFLKQTKIDELTKNYSLKAGQERKEKISQYRNRTDKDLPTKLLENYRPLLNHPDTYFQTIFSAINRDFPQTL